MYLRDNTTKTQKSVSWAQGAFIFVCIFGRCFIVCSSELVPRDGLRSAASSPSSSVSREEFLPEESFQTDSCRGFCLLDTLQVTSRVDQPGEQPTATPVAQVLNPGRGELDQLTKVRESFDFENPSNLVGHRTRWSPGIW